MGFKRFTFEGIKLAPNFQYAKIKIKVYDLKGPKEQYEIEFPEKIEVGQEIVMGRNWTSPHFENNEGMSRVHAKLQLNFGQLFLSDFSTYGTYYKLNQHDVYHLKDDDVIQVGKNVCLTFKIT